jgi:hypothetical protein
MLRVDSLNLNRETYKLVLLFYRGDEEPLRVEGSIPLTEKSQLFVTIASWRIETATWEDLRARMPNTAGALQPVRVELGLRSRIPMVIDSTVTCVAAVEDRTGRLSNFVPVSYAMLEYQPSLEDDGP